VNQIAAGPDAGTRYVFTGWSDGITDATRTISVTGNMVLVAKYNTQHKLTVNSDYGTPRGDGWYDEGAQATASLDTGIVSDNLFYDWVFTGWRGDATGSGLQSNAITMDSAKTATASWSHNFSTAFYGVVGAIAIVAIAVVVLMMMRRRRETGSRAETEQVSKPSNQKFCTNCGKKIPKEASICPKCGKPT
jgi:uncharacterized repeat protein (TIGR02543 family)